MALPLLTGADVNNQKIVNLADPSAATDAVNLQTLNARLTGLTWKQPVRAATTTTGTLATAYANGQSIDGVSLVTGDRILIKDQTSQPDNGIYVVNASGAPTRATDADSSAELDSAAVLVTSGTVNADNAYTQTTNAPTVGTTALVWAQFGGANLPTAGNGLSRSGNTLSVVAAGGGGITVAGGGVSVDTSIVARHAAASVGNGSATSIAVTHNLGTKDVIVGLRRVSDDAMVLTDWVATDVNTITLAFASAPSTNQYRVTVTG
ncbi:hypothetical protein ABZX65_26675 [Streptomyces sp. NPDC003300]|uniref:hypothetical protein n=1 Tax=unclassified Streptomyces TaxID=2593676 RepID=UPI0033A97E5D